MKLFAWLLNINCLIIFLIEDNHYAISTPTENMLPFRLEIFNKDLYTRVDGSDVFQVYDAAEKAIAKARTGFGPSILWCEVDRLDSHTAGDDHKIYRSQEELNEMVDPITFFSKHLITEEQFSLMQQEAHDTVLEIYKRVELEEDPQPHDVKEHLYGPRQSGAVLPNLDNDQMTMVGAVNWILEKGLASYPNLLMFGEDIEDPKGGVFGFTRGLSKNYKGRVLNAPIAEATIIGTAVGLSITGFKPVFEIQFIDFITPGFDQLVTQVSSLRWRSCSEWKCPLVLYAPYGAYLPAGGLWHSQSNDGWWAHIPGLRVAIPSSSQDVLELFWAAFQDEDPTLILIPKHIFRKKMAVINGEVLPFGCARIRRAGQDVTIVGWGNTIELIEEAANIKAESGISVEVIDLRTLVPCDWETIEKSIAKTGRLIVVHEDNRTCGFGGSIIAEMMSRGFDYFYSAPQLVARDDVHIPFHPDLEYAVLPDVQSILKAIDKVLN